MPVAVRPYVTAGVALVGASVITVTPIAPTSAQDEVRVVDRAVSLTAATTPGVPCSGYYTDGCDILAHQTYEPVALDMQAGSIMNIPANLVNAVISIPRAYIDALNDVAYALEVTGSWWVYTDTNVLGYDPADPPKITSATNLLIPFKALSEPLGEHLSWWAKANLPMNAGCTGTAPPTCQDANAILGKMFTAPIWDLIAGYVFPELNNPISPEETEQGDIIVDENGDSPEGAPVPWSGEDIQINPLDPVYSVINYLLADPQSNRPDPITLSEIVDTVVRLGKAMWLDFNPFVPKSFIWKGFPYTLVTPLFKPFAKWLCPTCNPDDPALPPEDDASGDAESSQQMLVAGLSSVQDAEETADTDGTSAEKAEADSPFAAALAKLGLLSDETTTEGEDAGVLDAADTTVEQAVADDLLKTDEATTATEEDGTVADDAATGEDTATEDSTEDTTSDDAATEETTGGSTDEESGSAQTSDDAETADSGAADSSESSDSTESTDTDTKSDEKSDSKSDEKSDAKDAKDSKDSKDADSKDDKSSSSASSSRSSSSASDDDSDSSKSTGKHHRNGVNNNTVRSIRDRIKSSVSRSAGSSDSGSSSRSKAGAGASSGGSSGGGSSSSGGGSSD
ncbi:hypothetical protein [Mycolicibacterium palauense]|uniref:hypothetical protein n=1 Tax=Mycolicibacterium palauense TaxID=2034511 RepID=UPI001145CE00|nr:hypothetical protein [Mycolicibacterium palauense]